jgi:hypothetical protein
MKPFDCDMCGLKIKPQDALVRWHFDAVKKSASILQVVHDRAPCNLKGEGAFFNRSLSLPYVFGHMPEFIAYIKRLKPREKELKDFVHRIEKDRSYIRRHYAEKKEVRKLIIRMDGLGE